MIRLSVIFALGVLITAFQNCQPARVSSSSDYMSKSELTPVVTNDPEDSADGSVTQNGESTAPSDMPPADMPPADSSVPAPAPAPAPTAEVEVPTHPGNGNNNGNPNNNPDADDADGRFVCILEGPGKSVKLGMTDALGGQNKIPKVLCMSRAACLDIASQAFEVKGPEFRGYCKLPHGNPHVIHVTDEELQQKVDDFLSQ